MVTGAWGFRWGADLTLTPAGGRDAMIAFGRLLDGGDLAAATWAGSTWEVTFRAEVSPDRAAARTADLADHAHLVASSVLARYPAGPLQVRCVPYAPVPLRDHDHLRGVALDGGSDGTTAWFTAGSGRAVEFPAGYTAADDPLTVLDARGRFVAAVDGIVGGSGAPGR